MSDGYEFNRMRCTIDGINDAKAADAVLPQSSQFSKQRRTTLRIVCDGANGVAEHFPLSPPETSTRGSGV